MSNKIVVIKKLYMASAAMGVLAFTSPSPVLAQDEQADDERDVVIVTARKREENLQDVPLAVTAFDSEALARKNITELEDVARFTAGFAFEDNEGGAANPNIRGISTLLTTSREQVVATFVDGVYMPRNWLVDIGTTGLERIEIVKGPQSARFGRNAFAGAINYVPRKPGDEPEAEASFTYGNHDRFDAGVALGFPIIKDLLSVYGSYNHTEFDGSWENRHPNANIDFNPGSPGNVGGWDNQSWTAHARFTPLDNLEFNVSYYGAKRDEEARPAQRLNTRQGTGNCGSLQIIDGGGFGPSLFCGEYDVFEDTVDVEPRAFGRQSRSDIFKASLDYDISDAINFSYSFGHVEADSVAAFTIEPTPAECGSILGPPVFPTLCNFQGSPAGIVNYDQHELRLAFDDGGRFRAAVGGFLLDGEDERVAISINAPALGTEPLMPDLNNSSSFPDLSNFIFGREFTKTEVWAIFGEFTYEVSDRLRLNAEGRFTNERIDTDNLLSGAPVGDATFEFFTPRVTLEYDVADANLLYATAGRGAKAGGFNPSALSPLLEVFDPEFNWTYEIGSKNVFLNGRLVMNAAAFLTKWKDQQIASSDPLGGPFTTPITRNLGNATVWGVELEGSFDATDNLSFDFAVSYNDPTFDDGTVDTIFLQSAGGIQTDPPTVPFPVACDDIVCAISGDISGNTLQNSPKTQFAIGAQWEDRLTDKVDYYIRADAGYQSSFFASQINTAELPSRIVTNARLGFVHDNVELAFWARNLTDEKYATNSNQIIQAFSNNILGTALGERRTYGATVTLRY